MGLDLEWGHDPITGAPKQTVDEIYNEIISEAQNKKTFIPNNVVILLHDEMFQTKWKESDLKRLIDKLRTDNNIVFEQMRFYPQ